jgi:YHS domain-containing protein
MAQNPVCKMQVNKKTAAAKTEHVGKTYYLCSEGDYLTN